LRSLQYPTVVCKHVTCSNIPALP